MLLCGLKRPRDLPAGAGKPKKGFSEGSVLLCGEQPRSSDSVPANGRRFDGSPSVLLPAASGEDGK